MASKVSTETVTPQKSIGDNLSYSFNYVYDDSYAHRLVRAGDRYYKYDANGNIICEQDGSFESNGDDVSYHKITKETEDVYSTDYGWGLFREEDDSGGGEKGSRYCRTYTWNERNQLISSIDANYNTAYVYGQDGQRSNKYTQNSETLYFNKMWTLHTDSGNNVYGGQSATNIYLGETRIVTKLNSGMTPTYQEEYYKQYFYHSDHLGSASLISDYKGDEYQRIEYTPYGETWVEKTSNTGLEWLPYKFTAKELDEETGLYYYGARYLDPKYSRWLSCDPALGEYISDPENSTSGGIYNNINLNLYHYANNNPVKYIDPDGRDSGYLNDGDAVLGAGHSAMFVETYDEKGNSTGYALYEVGSVTEVDGNWKGIGPGNIPIENTVVLSHETLDKGMGKVVGSVAGVSGVASGSAPLVVSSSTVGGSAIADAAIGSVNSESGVFVRYYSSFDKMKNAPENSRYNNVITFNTTQDQDIAIKNKADETGRGFGQYNLFTNNCTQYAANSLSSGGINTTNFLIPNIAREYILSNNSNYSRSSWRK